MDPAEPAGDVEAYLMENFAADIDVDVLQVGHHGSIASSRLEFLRAVSPRLALISSGPTRNPGNVVFPEAETLASLEALGVETYRTDLHDSHCPEADRIGMDDEWPGGCDNYLLELGSPD